MYLFNKQTQELFWQGMCNSSRRVHVAEVVVLICFEERSARLSFQSRKI